MRLSRKFESFLCLFGTLLVRVIRLTITGLRLCQDKSRSQRLATVGAVRVSFRFSESLSRLKPGVTYIRTSRLALAL